jgi:dTDP-4-amino-4,6-dideoxygalactose transaminase
MSEFRIPRSRAAQTHRALREQIFAALEPVLFQPHQLDNVALRPLESRFAEFVQRRFAYGVNSGTAALFLALKACGVGPDQEVITVGNSDIATTAAISHCGALPVLCDVRAEDYTLDPELVEARITPRTVALLPVDLYGYPADVKRLREIADRHGLKIVEDATLATGACDYGRPIGAFADVAVYSVNASKPLAATGNGGLVVTDDPELAAQVRMLRSYGRGLHSPPGSAMFGEHVAEGYNLPLDPLQAAIVMVKLPLLPQMTERRQQIARLYHEGLAGAGVETPLFRAESEPTFYLYVIRVADRDRIYTEMRRRGIEVGLHYSPPVHRQVVYRNHPLARSSLPVTERLANELLGLPIAAELEDGEVAEVIETVKELIG